MEAAKNIKNYCESIGVFIVHDRGQILAAKGQRRVGRGVNTLPSFTISTADSFDYFLQLTVHLEIDSRFSEIIWGTSFNS